VTPPEQTLSPKPRKPRKKKEVLSEEEPIVSQTEEETPKKSGKKKTKQVLSDEEQTVSPSEDETPKKYFLLYIN
jgi:hypothetical protein